MDATWANVFGIFFCGIEHCFPEFGANPLKDPLCVKFVTVAAKGVRGLHLMLSE